MLSSARNLYSRLRTHTHSEKGISTIEWIGLTAVVLVFLSAVFVYVQVHGGQVGAAAGSSMDSQIALWESGGSRVGEYPGERASDSPRGQISDVRDRIRGGFGDLRILLWALRADSRYRELPDDRKIALALADLRRRGNTRLADDLEAARASGKMQIEFDVTGSRSYTDRSGDKVIIHLSGDYDQLGATGMIAHEGFHALVGLERPGRAASLEEEVYAYYLQYEVLYRRGVKEDLAHEFSSIDFQNTQDARSIIRDWEPGDYKTEGEGATYTELFSAQEGDREWLRDFFERYR